MIIKTIATIALPSQTGTQDYNTAAVSVPIFFISGTKDVIISPFSANKKAYDALPAGVPAALGMRNGANHNAIQSSKVQWGYLTAWMLFELKHNKTASLAFAGSNAELLGNPHWNNALTKNIVY